MIVQWSHKNKKYTDKQLLEMQNKHLKKYGLPPKKRIDREIILRLLDDTPHARKTHIISHDEVMYQ
ncbi:MAG: hypothetical protein KAJ44_03525 [Thermoplasmatales archaeon]|nr:hypothetical protein [Thermoplasmatales archaeon]